MNFFHPFKNFWDIFYQVFTWSGLLDQWLRVYSQHNIHIHKHKKKTKRFFLFCGRLDKCSIFFYHIFESKLLSVIEDILCKAVTDRSVFSVFMETLISDKKKYYFDQFFIIFVRLGWRWGQTLCKISPKVFVSMIPSASIFKIFHTSGHGQL